VRLCYMGHATMENRHGLAVAGMVTLAIGTAERRTSETMLKAKAKEAAHRITVGEDKVLLRRRSHPQSCDRRH
jgi:hypothetical protein